MWLPNFWYDWNWIIGFLTVVHPFLWRDDLKQMIKETELYQSGPFHFRSFPGSLASNTKGVVALVLMVEVDWENVLSGLDYFCVSCHGENPLSPCGHPFIFFTLYHNQLSALERQNIIQVINHHLGQTGLVHLHGFLVLDELVTLKQNIKIKLNSCWHYALINPISAYLFR